MFDFQDGPWTPASFRPVTIGGRRFPRGLMPWLAEHLDRVSLLRGLHAPSTTHSIAQARLPTLPCLGMSGSASVYGRWCAETRACDFEQSCLSARELVRSAQTDQCIQITMGGWDSHADIYETALDAGNPHSLARRFDSALGVLLTGLDTDGLLSETLVVAMGEFGRTPGPLNAQRGRDHYPYHAALAAGEVGPALSRQREFSGGFWRAPISASRAAASAQRAVVNPPVPGV
jgi:hypothetical protein